MNEQSIAAVLSDVKVKTQTVALCAPSFESALNSVVTTGITAGFQPSFTVRELPTEKGKEVGQGGFVWLSNNVLSVVERLPKKCRPSVRSVLLAYAQLSSRRGNARTFPAAAELVATMAGCSVRTVHNADKQLVAAGLVTISRQKIQGRDVPRLVTLSEVAAAPPIAFEVVAVDDLPAVRQQRKKAVHTGMQVVQRNLHTLKKHSIEKHIPKDTSLSLCPELRGGRAGRGRESLEEVKERLAREHGMEAEEVGRLWEKHVANMEAGRAAGKVHGYATPANFCNNFDSLKARHHKHQSRLARYRGVGNPAAYAEPVPSERAVEEAWPRVQAAVKRATEERAARWKQFASTTCLGAPAFEEANEETRLAFMTSNEGATFLALAESWSNNGTLYTVEEETGRVLYRAPKANQSTTQSMAAGGWPPL
jgi:hypothetical protein